MLFGLNSQVAARDCIYRGWGQGIPCMILHLPIARSTISSDRWMFLYYKLIRLTKSELHPHLFVYRYATSAGQVISNTVTKHPTIFFIPHVSRCGVASHHTQILVTCCRSKFVVVELSNISHDHVISWLKCSNLSTVTILQNLFWISPPVKKHTGNGNYCMFKCFSFPPSKFCQTPLTSVTYKGANWHHLPLTGLISDRYEYIIHRNVQF